MKIKIVPMIVISIALIVVSSTNARPDKRNLPSTKSLSPGTELCRSKEQNDPLCKTFIMGFLKGAVLTDTAILETLDRADEEESSFTDRAMRTRLGNRTAPATSRAGFCLPDNKTIEEVAEKVMQQLKAFTAPSDDAGRNIYTALKLAYPCG